MEEYIANCARAGTGLQDGLKILHMYSPNDELQKDYRSIGECAKYLSDLFNKKYTAVYTMIWKVTRGERKSYLGYKFVYE